MAFELEARQADKLFESLSKEYDLYAPVRTDEEANDGESYIRYEKVTAFKQVAWDLLAHEPAKVAITPAREEMIRFTGDRAVEDPGFAKKRLIFARPCDIVSQEIQDNMFLKNGGIVDSYYKRARDRIKFAMMECAGGQESCFCNSMGGAHTDDWAFACRFSEDGLQAEVKDPSFVACFEEAGGKEVDYAFSYVEEDANPVDLPDLSDEEVYRAILKDPLWDLYGGLCVNALQCTKTCPTCTCFTVVDRAEEGKDPVRYRDYASCMDEDYEKMAKQKGMRTDNAMRTRFRVLHKIHDYQARFGHRPMCTGCGRCTRNCPKHINMAMIIKQVNKAVDRLHKEEAGQGEAKPAGEVE